MEFIYQNFDGLDVSFVGALPDFVLKQLEEARDEAQQRRSSFVITLMPSKLTVSVAESGSRGGYRYCFDTGPDGETWFIAHSNLSDRWNIRVSAHSLALALHGYAGVKNRILQTLTQLEAIGLLSASVSRVDYCFDFLAPESIHLSTANFIAHKNCKKTREGEKEVVYYMDAVKGDTVETLRVGKMPGRQVTIYNKSQETKAHGKDYWKDIWKLNDKEGTVWRVEVRAGKDELKKWGVTTFGELEAKVGDIILEILRAIRYTAPNQDSNRSRWPNAPFWQTCIDQAGEVLAPYISHANRENILRELRMKIVDGYKTRLQGNAIGLAAAQGRDISEIDDVIAEFRREMLENISDDYKKVFEKFQTAEKRFLHLVD